MASKAFRKKHAVKELKKEKAHETNSAKSSKKKRKIIYYAVIAVVVVVLVYLWVVSSMNVQFQVPEMGDAPSTGPVDAKVTFLEYGCFTCPYTKNFNLNVLPQLMNEYEGRVNFAFKHVPLPRSQGSGLAAEASQCANDQGKFWEYSKLLFSAGSSFNAAQLKGFADALGLDRAEFDNCLDSRKYEEKVRMDAEEGRSLRIAITPTVFLNGVRIEGYQDASVFRNIIDDMLSKS